MLQPTVQYIAVMIAITARAQLRLCTRARSPALKVDLPSEEPAELARATASPSLDADP
jgi:hypothetical protein